MGKTTGERSKQEAGAFRARAWYRDLENMTFGLGEYRMTDGTQHKMRHELRHMRTSQIEHIIQQRVCPGWLAVDSTVVLIGDTRTQQCHSEVHDMLETLRLQTQQVFTWHDYEAGHGERYASADVALHELGQFKTDHSWEEVLEQHPPLPDAFARDKD